MLCLKDAIGHLQVPVCTRKKLSKAPTWNSLACSHAKCHVSVQQLLHKYRKRRRKYIFMLQGYTCGTKNLGEHLGICVLSGFLLNDNFITFRNLTELPARRPLYHQHVNAAPCDCCSRGLHKAICSSYANCSLGYRSCMASKITRQTPTLQAAKRDTQAQGLNKSWFVCCKFCVISLVRTPWPWETSRAFSANNSSAL